MSSAAPGFPYHAIRSRSHVGGNLTSGGRITIGEKLSLSLYIRVGLVVNLTVAVLFFFSRAEREE
jgi:hypothetical protein